MAITAQLAHLIAETTYVQLPANVVTQAKRALLDTIGVTLAGHGEEAGRLITAWVQDIGGRQEAAVLGTALYTLPDLAVLANGTLGHILDFDDVTEHLQRVRLVHPDQDQPDWDTMRPDIVEVVLHDGRRLQQRVDFPKGDPALPLTWEELVAKFQDCAAVVLPLEQVQEAVQHIAHLEEFPTFQPLMASLTLASPVV